MRGAKILSVECRRDGLRFPFPANFTQRLAGRTIQALGRRAKYLLVDLDDGCVLIMHLGMSGSFRVEAGTVEALGGFHYARSNDRTHDHVVFHLSNGDRVVYNDPRRFGFMDMTSRLELEQHSSFKGLGAEPLGNAFGPEKLAQACAGKRTNLKAALLDQRVVAGLGTIYGSSKVADDFNLKFKVYEKSQDVAKYIDPSFTKAASMTFLPGNE